MDENNHMETSGKTPGSGRMSPFGHLFRFVGWWFGFTGLYAMVSRIQIQFDKWKNLQ
jgi:hypothetical protein